MLPNTRIFTGYFAKAQNYADKGMALVSIALKDPWFLPKDITLYSLKELTPTDEILALKDNPKAYTEKYQIEILGRTHIFETVERRIGEIVRKSKRFDVVLMCYEALDKFCHRHLVAKWLTENGIPTTEYGLEDALIGKGKEEETRWLRQQELFPLPGKVT